MIEGDAMKRTIVVLAAAIIGLAGVQGAAVARIRPAKWNAVRSVARGPVAVSPDENLAPHNPRVPHAAPRPKPAPKPKPVEYVFEGLHPRYAKGDVIDISIRNQRVTAWHDGKVVMQFLISTGRPGYATPRGHYRVIFKSKRVFSYDWGVWMPYAMNWYGNYFIHQLPHYPGSTTYIGASQLGSPASHGCVRVNLGDAERLFNWAKTGTPVWVH
jgi:lipoprotein-anchoring transpeptidase ErfK/SrfK